ncbi:MAG: Lrp/AsnC family transcriptional regulator [Gammaproteobacteria bacterium]|nr:MAG: Lrp/AsnC family transcriptional regulator [Gammaproteobacteria bacterium]
MVLTGKDRELIAAIQGGLPLVAKPYAVIGTQLGLSEAAVIERLDTLQAAGLIKRLGVVVRHRALGYRANAMIVWDVPDDDIKRIGRMLAGEECVTLCYQRPRHLPAWRYNLFCMIHGRERDSVMRRLEQIVACHGLEKIPHAVLFSGHCFKQRGAHYVETGNLRERLRRSHG